MILRDLLFGFRVLLRHRFSTALCVAVLGLGFTAVISVYTLVQRFVLSPLPYPDPERLVMVLSHYRDGSLTSVSPLVLRDFQERTRSLEVLGAYSTQAVHLLSGGEPTRVVAASVSAEVPGLLGMKSGLGRLFAAPELVPGQDRVVVLADSIWRNRFGSDPGILGKQINIDGSERTVVGVVNRSFQFPESVDLFLPLALSDIWYSEERRGWEFLTAIGRTRIGTGPAEAAKELSGILAEVAPRRAARGQGAEAVGLQRRLLGDRREALLALFLSASFLALMAWCNVANLLLARAESRTAEFSLRMALGAGPSGLLRLLVMESGILGLSGGVLGLGASYAILRSLRDPLMEYLTIPAQLESYWRVAILAGVVSVSTGVLFGVAPLLRASATSVSEALKGSRRGGASPSAGGLLRRGLVATQVAIAVCLLVAGLLLVTSFSKLSHVDPGFDPAQLLSLRLELPQSRYTVVQRGEFHQRLLEEVRALPGVSDAALTYALPLAGQVWTASFEIEGRSTDPATPDPGANLRPVSVSYFATMRIPLLKGRLFDTADSAGAPLVAIVDEALARRVWPAESPLGQRLLDIAGDRPITVVGIVGSVKDIGLATASNGHLYFPIAQRPDIREFNLVVRTKGPDPLALVPSVSGRVHDLDPLLPIFGVSTMRQRVTDTTRGLRQGVLLVSLFAIFAILLASAGIYAVTSHSVARRTNEMGIRLALGASGWNLLTKVLTDSLKLALPGLAAGFLLAWLLGRFAQSFISGASALDWAILLPVAGLTLGVSLLAGLHPGWRAARTDCMKAIRWE